MRRVRLFIASSLDGYIAGPNESLDWLFTDEDYGYDEFIEQVDVLAMGRRTFETVLGLGEWPYAGKRAFVFSRSENPPLDPRVTYTSQTPGEWLAERYAELAGNRSGAGGAESAKDVWLIGGGELIRGFLDEFLVDELIVAVHPVVLGGGIPLIPAGTHRHRLRLVSHKAFDSGLVQLHYVVQR
jgi:dihydrofolate reductase